MPRVASRCNPRITYEASAEYVELIEDALAHLEAWERGSGVHAIEQIVVHRRIRKGKAILAELLRRWPELAEDDDDGGEPISEEVYAALMLDVARLSEETAADVEARAERERQRQAEAWFDD